MCLPLCDLPSLSRRCLSLLTISGASFLRPILSVLSIRPILSTRPILSVLSTRPIRPILSTLSVLYVISVITVLFVLTVLSPSLFSPPCPVYVLLPFQDVCQLVMFTPLAA